MIVVIFALLVAACGGSSTVQSTTDKYAAALAYSRCMRSHGVANFPDPTQGAGGIQISGSQSGLSPQSPVLASAKQSCRHLLPEGGEPTHADRRQALARMLRTSRCMRAHGVPSFPDPTASAPSDRAGYSSIMSNGGAWLAIPGSIDLGTPAFKHAAAACALELS
ncbi:MAG: hypothetical protein ACREOE_03610 [Gemmatimonadales bacterium]